MKIVVATVVLFLISLNFLSELSLEWGGNFLFPYGNSSPTERAEFENQMGFNGFIFAVIKGGKEDDRKQFIELWVSKLLAKRDKDIVSGREPLLRYILHKLPIKFFEDRRLLYLDVEDLLDIEARLKQRLEQERQKKNPFYVDLEDAQETEVDISFEDLRRNYGVEMVREYYSSTDKEIFAILFKPNHPSTKTKLAKSVIEEIEKTGNEIRRSTGLHNVNFVLGGPYVDEINHASSMSRALLFALGIFLVGYSLLVGFVTRQIRAVILLWVTAITGLAWIGAIVALWVQTITVLNALAIYIIIILGAIGGLSISRVYLIARGRQYSQNEAMQMSILREGRFILLGGISSLVGFASLILIKDPDIERFSLIAMTGVLVQIITTLVVLPTIVLISEKLNPMTVFSSVRIRQSIAWKVPRGRFLIIFSVIIMLVGLIVFYQSANCLSGNISAEIKKPGQFISHCIEALPFDAEFGDFMPYSASQEAVRREFERAVPIPYQPIIILAENREYLRRFLNAVEKKIENGEILLRSAVSLQLAVPSDQEQKLVILDRIDELATDEEIGFLDQKTLKKIDEIRPVFHPPLIGIYQLPIRVIQAFSVEVPNSRSILNILERALSNQPQDIEEKEWRFAVRQTLELLPTKDLFSLAQSLANLDLIKSEIKKSDPAALDDLVGAIRKFHDRYVGTVAFLYPSIEPLNGFAALHLNQLLENKKEAHKGIKISGIPIDIANTLQHVFQKGLMVISALFLGLSIIILFAFPRPVFAFVLLCPPIFIFSLLLLGAWAFQASWNIYEFIALPVAIVLVFNFAAVVYLQYWRIGQIGALQTIISSSQGLVMAMVVGGVATIGWTMLPHGGFSNMGTIVLIAFVAGPFAAVSVLTPVLQIIHSYRYFPKVKKSDPA